MKIRVRNTIGVCDARLAVAPKGGMWLRITYPSGEHVFAEPEVSMRMVTVVWATQDEIDDLLRFGFMR